MSYRSKFSSVGMYVPPRVVKNDDLKQYMDTSDEWIQQRTGIKQRYWIDDPSTMNSDLAVKASLEAINKAGIKKSDIDLIIYATLSPDHEFPGTGCFLQAKLDLGGIPVIDVRQQCTGFIYASSIADQFIRTGMYQNILVVGSELQSKGLQKTTEGRDIAVLFGDGAGATVVSRCEVKDPKTDSHILSSHLWADGNFAKELWTEAPGVGFDTERVIPEMIQDGRIWPKMNGKQVFVHATKRMPEAIVKCLEHNKTPIDDVDLFVLHQANIRINEMCAKVMKIAPEKVFNTIESYGNTTAATIPIGLSEAERQGKLKKGMLVCSAAFGSGFTWASMLYRW